MSNFLFVLVVGLFLIAFVKCNKNNVCPTFRDYYNKETNPRCWYDPDVFSDVNAILNRYKYTYEVHTAITPDGYILSVYRLPPKRSKSKGLVYLAHCLTCNMMVWIDKGNQSAAFLLVEAGYDVWLGNFRGTLYSLEHITLSRTHQPNEYFNFSMHEMGVYDVPTHLELIRNVSGSSGKIYYIGYSLGSTVATIYASMLPKHAKEYINLFILSAPSVFLNITKSIYRRFAPFIEIVVNIVNFHKLTNSIVYNNLTLVLYSICFEYLRLPKFCNTLADATLGLDPENTSPQLYPAMFIHNGYMFSPKSIHHYAQICNSGRFQLFDYGEKNMYYYNSQTPPHYPLENISVPIYLFYGSSDAVAPVAENLLLYSKLRPEVRYGMTELGYNHFNLMYGKNIYENIYLPIIDIMENFQNKNSTT